MNEITTQTAQDIAEAPPAQSGPAAVLSAIVALAKDPSVDADKLEKLLAMQERMEAREAQRLFIEALTRIQAKAPRIPKNGIVSLGKGQQYDFAKWEDMDALIAPLLKEEGFAVTFSEDSISEHGIRWAATWRAFGHSETNHITLPPDGGAGRNALQARGSTNSYAKRYLTEDFLKLVRAGADDDGKRGGTQFITDAQHAELVSLCAAAKREPRVLLNRLIGPDVNDLTEIEASQFIIVKNTLDGIIQQQAKKGTP